MPLRTSCRSTSKTRSAILRIVLLSAKEVDAFEVSADEMVSPHERDLLGGRSDLFAAGGVEGGGDLVLWVEGPLVDECLPFAEVVGPAAGGFEHLCAVGAARRGVGHAEEQLWG